MLMSKLFGKRMKDVPSEASLVSHVFLLRGGYVKSVSSGIYSLLTPAVKIKRKIENIIRKEMEKIGGQEIEMPVVLPSVLWEKSGRFTTVGKELLRFRDRNCKEMLLAMTHEEAVVDLANHFATSYIDYPFMLYQIQTKFRDEPRARGGLIRLREFTMKDAYSFHLTQQDLDDYYIKVLNAYKRIYEKIGLPEVVEIESDSGMMGGNTAHEFMLFSDAGEDSVVTCENCNYKANMEVADSVLTDFAFKDISSVNILTFKVTGTLQKIIVLIAPSLSVNENKLLKLVKKEINEVKSETLNLESATKFIEALNEQNAGTKIFYDVSVKDVFKEEKFFELYKVKDGQRCKMCGSELKIKRGIEVGNIFKLGTKYTDAMNAEYANNENKKGTALMGCYGIGISRLIASLIEAKHDAYGPIWPKSVTPWQVHICALNIEDEDVYKKAFKAYEELSKFSEVILDDRHVSAGVKFSDADLLGVPIRVIVSKKNASNDFFEVKLRGKTESTNTSLNACIDYVKEFYGEFL